MKTNIKLIILFLAIILLDTNPVTGSDLISAQELTKILKDENTIIVSCCSTSDYQKGHLPGAVNIPHKELYSKPVANGYLKPAAELAEYFGSKGIGNYKTIVLYDEGSGKYAGRIYWILKYLGAPNVKILDGQMKGWCAARNSVTKTPVSVKTSIFTANVQNNLIATAAQVKTVTGLIVDVRSLKEYSGTDDSAIRKGHIPNAINFDFSQVMDNNSMMKKPEKLAKLFNSNGITPDKEIILYCRTGVRASLVFFVLSDMLKYNQVRVYDESFFGWQSDSNNNVVK